MRSYCTWWIRTTSRLALLLLLLHAAPALADNGGATLDADDTLYLSVVVNRQPRKQLVRALQRDGQLLVSAADLHALGLDWDAGEAADANGANPGFVRIDRLPGVSSVYDEGLQRLTLTVPVSMLGHRPQRLEAERAESRAVVDPATLAPGFYLNYDWYAQRQADISSLSATSDLHVFGVVPGNIEQTLLTRAAGPSSTSTGNAAVRLDTSWTFDDPQKMTTLALGDGVSGSLSWTRATRIGGLHFSRDFDLQPYRVTTPLALLQGEATLPSSVDLYINGIRQLSRPVSPGTFQIDNIPTINGLGMAQMVITDINGQSRRIDVPLYGGLNLMQAGLSDWSFDVGRVRQNYGLTSFSYAPAIATDATWRYGVTNGLTVEGHSESDGGMVNAGGGFVALLGHVGMINASFAGNRFDYRRRQLGVGYQWTSPRWFAAASFTTRTPGYEDTGSLNGSELSRRETSASLGWNWHGQSVGLSWVQQLDAEHNDSHYGMINWSVPLWRNSSMNVSVARAVDTSRTTTLYASLYLPLGHQTSVSSGWQSSGTSRSLSANVNHVPLADTGGWGWRVQGATGDGGTSQAEVSRLGNYGQVSVGVQNSAGQTGAYASGTGSVIFMPWHVYARREVENAFALVSTDGIPDVPVLQENRVIGRSDSHGWIFVDRLNSYQHNTLMIDPVSLPPDWIIDKADLDAVPPRNAGIVMHFDLQRDLGVQMTLRDADGHAIAPGSRAWVSASPSPDAGRLATQPAEVYVGFDGLLYLQNPPAGGSVLVEDRDLPAGHCAVRLPSWSTSAGRMDLGTQTCQ